MADEIMSQSEAWSAYDQWMADSRIFFIEEPQTLEESFRSFSSESRAHPKDWAEAYIAAFAAVGGLRVVTFDSGFRRRLADTILLTQ